MQERLSSGKLHASPSAVCRQHLTTPMRRERGRTLAERLLCRHQLGDTLAAGCPRRIFATPSKRRGARKAIAGGIMLIVSGTMQRHLRRLGAAHHAYEVAVVEAVRHRTVVRCLLPDHITNICVVSLFTNRKWIESVEPISIGRCCRPFKRRLKSGAAGARTRQLFRDAHAIHAFDSGDGSLARAIQFNQIVTVTAPRLSLIYRRNEWQTTTGYSRTRHPHRASTWRPSTDCADGSRVLATLPLRASNCERAVVREGESPSMETRIARLLAIGEGFCCRETGQGPNRTKPPCRLVVAVRWRDR